jgi:hypothetical protein
MDNCSSGEISVGMYKLKDAKEKFCSDHLVSHHRSMIVPYRAWQHGGFFSHQKVIKSLLMDTGHKPLQSVNLS